MSRHSRPVEGNLYIAHQWTTTIYQIDVVGLDGLIQPAMQFCTGGAEFEHIAEHRNAPPAWTDDGLAEHVQRRRHRRRIGVVAFVDQGGLAAGHKRALSAGKRGGYAENAAGLEAQAVSAIRAGDAIMIKGSLGSKMKTIVNALEKRFPGNAAHDEATV